MLEDGNAISGGAQSTYESIEAFQLKSGSLHSVIAAFPGESTINGIHPQT